MSDCCDTQLPSDEPGYRRVLWWVLWINVGMFAVEVVSGYIAGSLSLQADALDFLGDAVTYGITLFVLGRSVHWRAGAAMLKGAAMLSFGIAVLGAALHRTVFQTLPEASIMGSVGVMALAANLAVLFLLLRYRHGDSNRRSVWLCSRNDCIANLAVIAAAGVVAVTGTGWADLAVAVVIAALCVSSGLSVLSQARGEIRSAEPST